MDAIYVNLVTLAQTKEITLSTMLSDATPVVKGVLLVLVLMSVVSWYIIVYKWLYLRKAQKESSMFLEAFWQSKRLDEIWPGPGAAPEAPVGRARWTRGGRVSSRPDDRSRGTLQGLRGAARSRRPRLRPGSR